MSRDRRGDAPAAERKGIGRVTGVVLSTSQPRTFDLETKKQATISKDYRHITVGIKNGKRVKIYFPITANISGLKEKGSMYSRNDFVKIQKAKGKDEWIPYQIFNPSLLVGKKIEVTGEVTKNADGNYYMNRISEMKVFQ